MYKDKLYNFISKENNKNEIHSLFNNKLQNDTMVNENMFKDI